MLGQAKLGHVYCVQKMLGQAKLGASTHYHGIFLTFHIIEYGLKTNRPDAYNYISRTLRMLFYRRRVYSTQRYNKDPNNLALLVVLCD